MNPARILIVDDEEHIIQVLTVKLRGAGYEVLTAMDGEEALEIACRTKPDLVITDYQMPFMTGLDLCEALGKRPDTASIPVLLLTARGHGLSSDALAVAGNIRAVVSKPFSPRAVLQRIASLIGGDQIRGAA